MAVLKTLTGSGRGETVMLSEHAVIGRHPKCHVVLRHAAVSRHHARLRRADNGWVIEDLASQNGTWLNGKPITDPTRIADGDIIQICGFQFQFYQEADSVVGNTPNALMISVEENAPPRDLAKTDEFPWQLADAHAVAKDAPTPPPPAAERRRPPSAASTDDSPTATGIPDEMTVLARMAIDPHELRSFGDRSVAELDSMIGLMQLLAGATNREQLIQSILDRLALLIPAAEEVGILLLDDSGGLVESRRRDDDDWRLPARPLMRLVRSAIERCEATLTVTEDSRPPSPNAREASEPPQRTVLTVPLIMRGERPLGALQLSSTGVRGQLGPEALALLVSLSLPVALALHCSVRYENRLRQHLLERDVAYLRSLRHAFNRPIPQIPGYDLAVETRVVAGRSSDFSVVAVRQETDALVLLGDTGREGVESGILAASFTARLREAFAQGCRDVTELTSMVNAWLSEFEPRRAVVSALLGILDVRSHHFRFANCGLPPLVCWNHARAEAQVVGDHAANMALGMMTAPVITVEHVALQPGDLCVVLSDGVPGTRDSLGENFGMQRVAQRVAAHATGPPDRLCDAVLQAALQFRNFTVQDDLSVMVLRRGGGC